VRAKASDASFMAAFTSAAASPNTASAASMACWRSSSERCSV
jgi:hypothetical protein